MSQIKCSFCDYIFSETEHIPEFCCVEDGTEIRLCNNCWDEIIKDVLKEEKEEKDAETLKIT